MKSFVNVTNLMEISEKKQWENVQIYIMCY